MTSRLLRTVLAATVVLAMASAARAQSGRKPGEVPSGSSAKSGPGDPFDQATAKDGGKSPGDATGPTTPRLEKATFGAGCFWHVEAEFEWLPGVKSAVSGYSGGSVPHPSYEEVHEGITGHAEVVQVEFDPSTISYEQLLKVFWHGHDPTQWNRQGPDVGTQYRSVIFYHNEAQRKAALQSYRELVAARAYRAPIVTQLLPMKAFYRAEEYHQNYYGGKDDRPVARRPRSRRAATPARKSTPAASRAATPKKGTAAKTAGSRGNDPAAAQGRPAADGQDLEP